MNCKHGNDKEGHEVNGHWKQDGIWICDDCGKELKPHYFCKNCETDEWIDCEVIEK